MLVAASPLPIYAATVNGVVLDEQDKPVADAVISLLPQNRDHLPSPTAAPDATMDQWQKQFIPYNLPVQVGASVSFPNRDNLKHHVYSFSPAKKFEIKLYSGSMTKPIVFDKPGVIALGCNIHDWMLGYIYVLETPYFAKTDDSGKLSIDNLPDDDYVVSVWHPRLSGQPEKHDQKLSLKEQSISDVSFTISLKRERRRRSPPDFEEEVY